MLAALVTALRAYAMLTLATNDYSWANKTDEWVRLLCVVLAADPARVEGKELGESWLQ